MFEDMFGNKIKPRISPSEVGQGDGRSDIEDYIIGGKDNSETIPNSYSENILEPIGISPDSIKRGYEGFGQDDLSAVVESEGSAITEEDFIDIPMSDAEKAEALRQAGNQNPFKKAA